MVETTSGCGPKLSAFADESSEEFKEQLDAVQRNGITHIELRSVDGVPVHQQSLKSIRTIKKQADEAGIEFSAVGSALGKCDIDGDMTGQQNMCRHLVEIASILETPYIRMFSFKIPTKEAPGRRRQEVIDNLGALIDIVRGTGVILAHENEKHIYGETAEHCLDLYRTFYDSGVFKGIFDFANFVQAGLDPVRDCWPLLRDYSEYFHIKDALLENGRVVPAGQGDGGIRQILGEALREGSPAFLTLEPHLWPRYFEGNSAERFDLAAGALKELLAEIPGGRSPRE